MQNDRRSKAMVQQEIWSKYVGIFPTEAPQSAREEAYSIDPFSTSSQTSENLFAQDNSCTFGETNRPPRKDSSYNMNTVVELSDDIRKDPFIFRLPSSSTREFTSTVKGTTNSTVSLPPCLQKISSISNKTFSLQLKQPGQSEGSNTPSVFSATKPEFGKVCSLQAGTSEPFLICESPLNANSFTTSSEEFCSVSGFTSPRVTEEKTHQNIGE